MGVPRLSEYPSVKSVTDLLHRAEQYCDSVFAAETRALGVTSRQVAVLNAARMNEKATQQQLSALTGIDRSTLAEIMRRLTKRGYLTRRRTAHDRRAYAVSITDAGLDTLFMMAPRVAKIDAYILSILPEGRRAAFLNDLSQIAGALDECDDEKSDSRISVSV